MRAVPPHRCPRCGFESLTLSECAVCDRPLVDADGRAIAPRVARTLGGRSQRDLAAIGGLAVAGGAMLASGFLGLLAGSVGAAASIGGSALAGALVWRSLRRRRPSDAVVAAMRGALAVRVRPDGQFVEGSSAIARGRVHSLRSVVPAGEAPVAAFRRRTVGAVRHVGVLDAPVPGETEEQHVAGRFAVLGGRDVALVDEDWVLVVARGEDLTLRASAELVVVADGATVTVCGPAARGPAEDASRFAATSGYRDAGQALVFDGHEGAPVVVIVEPEPGDVSDGGSRAAAR